MNKEFLGKADLADDNFRRCLCMETQELLPRDRRGPTSARTPHSDLRTLDQANGGIVRNISHEGIGLQAVAALRPQQQLRVRFELRHPRLRVETRGEVTWATRSGQCGIRFLELSPKTDPADQ